MYLLTLVALAHATNIETRPKNHCEQDENRDQDHERVPYLL